MDPEIDIPLPETMPAMVLGGAVVFPHGLLPLFIFEPRYRQMLSYALEHDRMFCVGNVRPGVDPEIDPDPVHEITAAGLVRACVTHEDGTSHLMLAGMQRIRLLDWTQEAPFRIARVEPVFDVIGDSEATCRAAAEVIELCERALAKAPQDSTLMAEHLQTLREPGMLSDVVAQNFVNDVDHRQKLIETPDVGERLALLATFLSSIVTEEEE